MQRISIFAFKMFWHNLRMFIASLGLTNTTHVFRLEPRLSLAANLPLSLLSMKSPLSTEEKEGSGVASLQSAAMRDPSFMMSA